MKELILGCGNICLIDLEDYELVKNFTWRIAGAGYVCRNSIDKKGKQKSIYIHRLVMNAETNQEIDHINGNKLDNRKINLRFCSRKENCRKRPKNFKRKNLTSKFKGVSKSRDFKKFRARIFVKGKEMFLGTFDTEIEAAEAYNKAAKKHFKKYAKLNEINYD